MPKFVDPDPVKAFAAAVSDTVALKGHAKVTDGSTAETSAPNRIVLFPETGILKARAKSPALLDVDLTVLAAIWAESPGHSWQILRRLVMAAREHGRAGGPLVEFDRVEWPVSDDTTLHGVAMTVRFVLRAQPLLPLDPSTGEVHTVTLERQA